jgi:nitrogen-specific signal transduction histidine kinase
MQAAQEEVDRLNTAKKLERLDMIASSASGILRSIFGKNKAAAIAAAVIDVAAAIVKCFAQFGWWGFIPAAAVAAAGYEQIQQIRNTNPEGFAQGTPDMAFMDFGRSSLVPLHEDEAVVNRAQGATLAEMVVDAVELRDDRVLRQLERMDETQRARDRNLPLLMRDMALLARA